MTPNEEKARNPPSKEANEIGARCAAPLEIKPQLLKILQSSFKLTEMQARAYTALLAMGQLTPDEIVIYAGMPFANANEVIDVLLKRQLIKPLPGIVARYRAFSPYKEFAEEVRAFTTETNVTWTTLQELQQVTIDELRTEFKTISRHIQTALENFSERQGIAINEASMTASIVLNNIAESLQKSLSALSSSTIDDFSNYINQMKGTLQESINKGLKQLRDAHSLALEKSQDAITAHKETSEHWVTSIVDRLLERVDGLSQQIRRQTSDAQTTFQSAIDSEITTTRSEISSREEEISENTEDSISKIITNITKLQAELNQVIEQLHIDQNQLLTKTLQETKQKTRDSCAYRIQALERVIRRIETGLAKETRRLSQLTQKSSSKIKSALTTTRQTSTQLSETIFQELQNAFKESSQEYRRLQKETENTISQWPPSALDFSQFSKIKVNLGTLLEQTQAEYEQLFTAADEIVGVEMRDAYLTQLLEIQSLLESLANNLQTHQTVLTKNIQSNASKLSRRLSKRVSTHRKTADAFVNKFQTKLLFQENQLQTLGNRSQELIKQQSTVAIEALKNAETQLKQFTETRLIKAQTKVNKSADVNLIKVTKARKDLTKQLRTFSAATKKLTKETNQILRQEFAQLERIAKQYTKSVEGTADNLRDEQLSKAKNATANYHPTLTKLQTKRERRLSRIFGSTRSQLTRRNNAMFKALKVPLAETVKQLAIKALSAYKKAFTKQQTSMEEEAIELFKSTLSQRLATELSDSVNAIISKILEQQVNRLFTEYKTATLEQQKNFTKQAQKFFTDTSTKITAIQQDQLEDFKELLTKEISNAVIRILRSYRTKLRRQTNRSKQISKIFNDSLVKVRQVAKTVLPRVKKAQRDELTNQLTIILGNFMEQLERQTDREDQIGELYQGTLEQLQQLPQQMLPDIINQCVVKQDSIIQSALSEFRTNLEQLQKSTENQNLKTCQTTFDHIQQFNHGAVLKTPLSKFLIDFSIESLTDYRTHITEKQSSTEESAVTSFQDTLTRLLSTKLENLQALIGEEKYDLSDIVTNASEKIGSTIHQYDVESRALIDKYWLPLTKIIEDYSTILIGNLRALNTAISAAIDQASLNVTASLTNFGDDANGLIVATSQGFEREKTTLNELASQSITEMQKECIAQLQETHTLLDTFRQDISAQETALSSNIDTFVSEIEGTTIGNLSIIRETADAFILDLQTKTGSLEEQLRDLIKKAKELIEQQGKTLTDALAVIQGQLDEFSQTQIFQTRSVVEEIGANYSIKIDEHRNAFDNHLNTFATTLMEETDDFTSTLQQEIVQLQTVASKLNEKIRESGKTIEIKLAKQLESSKVNLHTVLEKQLTTLSKEISLQFQTFNEQFDKNQDTILKSFKQEMQADRELVEESLEQMSASLEKTQTQFAKESEERQQSYQDFIDEQVGLHKINVTDAISGMHLTTKASLEQSADRFTALLTNYQKDLDKIITTTVTALDAYNEKFQTTLSKEMKQTLQSFNQSLDLVKTRLTRASKDGVNQNTEALQSFQESALVNMNQTNDAITSVLRLIVDHAEEGIIAQAQQSGRRISRSLSKERKALKAEYQNLAKEVSAKAKETETTLAKTLESFTKNTQPILNRLRTSAGDTETLLIGLWNTITKLQPSEAERTWRIVTCEGIETRLLDMYRRVKDTITLVYPTFEEVPVAELSRVRNHSRVHLITSIEGEKQQTAARKLLEQGNIRIWMRPKIEFYAGSRDGEEVLIAPTHGDVAEIVAVVSDQESYISLFNYTLGPRWISTSQEIRKDVH